MRHPAPRDVQGYYLTTEGQRSHFHRSEFYCRDGCGLQEVSQELIDRLEALRHLAGDNPIWPFSGCRCKRHNAAVGGAPASRHLPRDANGNVIEKSGITGGFSDAADIVCKALTIGELYQKALCVGFNGVGHYASWVHVDTRPAPRVIKPLPGSDWQRG